MFYEHKPEETTEQEAIRALELANNGYYTLDSIPKNWRTYSDDVERICYEEEPDEGENSDHMNCVYSSSH